MEKKPFVTKEQLDEIVKKYPTPFHLYDEKGIRENARAMKAAFSWNKGFKEYFAVKATPNPFLIQILREYGFGCDCSSYTELMLSKAIGCTGNDIMFSSNDTPAKEFQYAYEMGATINLDDITHIPFLEEAIGTIPKRISCRFNPGGLFQISNDIIRYVLSIFPAALESLTVLTRSRMISGPSVKACGRFMKKYWFPQVWAMWLYTQN